jgi:predicted  nucleic acid-binding Zn-ribbon protein
MHADLVIASRLQALDQRIAALEKEIALLPKDVAVIEKQLEGHIRRLETDKASLTANGRDRKKLEGDVELARQKVTKLRDQMMSAKTNDQYKAFQHEIDFLDKEMRSNDDRTLDLMSAAEPLEAAVKKAESALKIEKQHVDAEKKKAEARTAEDRKAVAEAKAERAAIVASAPPALIVTYENIRRRWGGTVVTEIEDNLCKGCKLSLRPQFLQDLRLGSKVMQCENCGRMILYNPPIAPVVG